ncbi:unnamed protein product [Mycena citricolor]|uniref:Uncharacterized protein n=1 Tax=Mycena citricolor TaxID=2018698 RepID=A0AAD2HG48_9AGAR|nr:unnamed protein product [Mycena citricolor]
MSPSTQKSKRRARAKPSFPFVVGYTITAAEFRDAILLLPKYQIFMQSPEGRSCNGAMFFSMSFNNLYGIPSPIFIDDEDDSDMPPIATRPLLFPTRTVPQNWPEAQRAESPWDRAVLKDMVDKFESIGGKVNLAQFKWKVARPESDDYPFGYNFQVALDDDQIPPARPQVLVMLSLFPCELGLSLPDFRSILVTGPYHASAPVHLLLSRATLFPGTRAVLITPSQGVIAAALQEHNDAWLSTHFGQGRTLELSWCTTVYYPPTPAHFAFLLSMLSTDVDKTPSETVLEGQPSLVVLVELSAYFLGDVQVNPDRHSWTLSSYMSLIARVWAFVGGLGKDSPVSVALFDSGLDRLKLPIVKNPSAESKRPSKDENAIFFVQKYFDTMAVFEKGRVMCI